MDYIRFFKLSGNERVINLVSEVITDQNTAESACVVMHHKYKAIAFVRETYTAGEYVVFANKVPYRLISANYRKEYDHFIIANWL